MNKLKVLILFSMLVVSEPIYAQTTNTPATQLAYRIAQKMKDTLGLTVAQRTQIYNINVNLNDRKMAIRQQFTNPDSLRIKMQRVERGRDSLYHLILPEPKFQLYLQKKKYLVSTN